MAPGSFWIFKLLGYLLLIPGLVYWGTAVIQLLVGFPQGKLITYGANGIARKLIYSSAAFFILSAIALFTTTWVHIVP